MLKVLLNRLKSQAESIIVEGQAGFRTGRSTIDRSSILGYCRYLQQQQDLYHVFIDCKRAFDRLWHKALWSTLRLYNINANLIQVFKTSTQRAQTVVVGDMEPLLSALPTINIPGLVKSTKSTDNR